jgi:branched-chain amino acid transport system ATP-binding protein
MSLLELSGVTVRFGGHVAVDSVTLAVEPGVVTGLIGPNGAGKTTLFNAITGLVSPNGGRIRLEGRDITHVRAHRRARLGVARTFQRLELFGSLTVYENVLFAAELRRRWGRRSRGAAAADPAALAELLGVDEGCAAPVEAEALLGFVGLDEHRGTRADELPTGQARLVELARALASRPRLLLLDEPASGQDEHETAVFAGLLRRLAGTGLGVLLVEHDVPLVMSTCAVVHVLDFGILIRSGTPDVIQGDQRVLDAYLGTAPASSAVAAAADAGPIEVPR